MFTYCSILSPSPAIDHSFTGKAKLTKKELQVREPEIRGNIHLLGKAKVKKWEQQGRERGIRVNEHLHGKEKLKERE